MEGGRLVTWGKAGGAHIFGFLNLNPMFLSPLLLYSMYSTPPAGWGKGERKQPGNPRCYSERLGMSDRCCGRGAWSALLIFFLSVCGPKRRRFCLEFFLRAKHHGFVERQSSRWVGNCIRWPNSYFGYNFFFLVCCLYFIFSNRSIVLFFFLLNHAFVLFL